MAEGKVRERKTSELFASHSRTRHNLPWQDHFIVDFLWLTENEQWKSIIYSSTYTDQHSDHIYNFSHNSASLQVVLLFYNRFNFEV